MREIAALFKPWAFQAYLGTDCRSVLQRLHRSTTAASCDTDLCSESKSDQLPMGKSWARSSRRYIVVGNGRRIERLGRWYLLRLCRYIPKLIFIKGTFELKPYCTVIENTVKKFLFKKIQVLSKLYKSENMGSAQLNQMTAWCLGTVRHFFGGFRCMLL